MTAEHAAAFEISMLKQSPTVVQANEQVMHVRCTGGPRPRFARQRSRRHSRTGGRGLHVGAGVVIAHLRGRRIGARVTAQLLAGKDVVGTATLISLATGYTVQRQVSPAMSSPWMGCDPLRCGRRGMPERR